MQGEGDLRGGDCPEATFLSLRWRGNRFLHCVCYFSVLLSLCHDVVGFGASMCLANFTWKC